MFNYKAKKLLITVWLSEASDCRQKVQLQEEKLDLFLSIDAIHFRQVDFE